APAWRSSRWGSRPLMPGASTELRRPSFNSGDLGEASAVSLGAAERRSDEGLRVIPGDLDAHDPPAQAQDVHVVVLDPLADRVMVVAQAGPDPSHLVGGHGRPDPATADDDPAVELAGRHGAGERNDVVGVVVVRIARCGT